MSMNFLQGLWGELNVDGKSACPYTWNGKGWGGANIDADGNRTGLDCSGFAQGFLRRVGYISHETRTPENWLFFSSQGMYDAGDPVDESSLVAGDLVCYGASANGGIYHVGLVLIPGSTILDCGGGGSKTYPGGSDWPTSGRAFRVQKWGFRFGEGYHFSRMRDSVTTDDKLLMQEWKHIVDAWRLDGTVLPLSSELQKYKYRHPSIEY